MKSINRKYLPHQTSYTTRMHKPPTSSYSSHLSKSKYHNEEFPLNNNRGRNNSLRLHNKNKSNRYAFILCHGTLDELPLKETEYNGKRLFEFDRDAHYSTSYKLNNALHNIKKYKKRNKKHFDVIYKYKLSDVLENLLTEIISAKLENDELNMPDIAEKCCTTHCWETICHTLKKMALGLFGIKLTYIQTLIICILYNHYAQTNGCLSAEELFGKVNSHIMYLKNKYPQITIEAISLSELEGILQKLEKIDSISYEKIGIKFKESIL